jgi:hypothetical protein
MFGALWSTILICVCFLVPESPRWVRLCVFDSLQLNGSQLLWKGRSEEALRVFEDLHKDPRDPE